MFNTRRVISCHSNDKVADRYAIVRISAIGIDACEYNSNKQCWSMTRVVRSGLKPFIIREDGGYQRSDRLSGRNEMVILIRLLGFRAPFHFGHFSDFPIALTLSAGFFPIFRGTQEMTTWPWLGVISALWSSLIFIPCTLFAHGDAVRLVSGFGGGDSCPVRLVAETQSLLYVVDADPGDYNCPKAQKGHDPLRERVTRLNQRTVMFPPYLAIGLFLVGELGSRFGNCLYVLSDYRRPLSARNTVPEKSQNNPNINPVANPLRQPNLDIAT